MWDFLGKISEQVGKYSTWIGQLWYLCVFVFRLIVVVTIGGAVYNDELSAFECSTDEPGCSNMCFNAFSKMSHMRFWAFQLLAVATPTVLFHFFSMGVTGEIEKLKEQEAAAVDDVAPANDSQFRKMSRRKKTLEKVKAKTVYSGGELKEVYFTKKIHLAYFASVIARLTMEAVFIYLANQLFRFEEGAGPDWNGKPAAFDFIWFRVPAMYLCRGFNAEATRACPQALGFDGGYVPCWVSRPWEKTVFIRYMNVLSAVCFSLCVFELTYLSVKAFVGERKHRSSRYSRRNPNPPFHSDAVFYATAHNGHHLDHNGHHSNHNAHYLDHGDFRPTVSVPVQLSNKHANTTSVIIEGRKVRISDEDEVLSEAYQGSTASVRSRD